MHVVRWVLDLSKWLFCGKPIRMPSFWPIRSMFFGPIKLHLHEDELWLCKCAFPFCQTLKTAFPRLEMKHWRHLIRAEQTRLWQGISEQSKQGRAVYLERGLPSALLLHNQAPCTWLWIEFPSSSHPKLVISVGIKSVRMIIHWQVER